MTADEGVRWSVIQVLRRARNAELQVRSFANEVNRRLWLQSADGWTTALAGASLAMPPRP